MRLSCHEHRDCARGKLARFDNSQNIKMTAPALTLPRFENSRNLKVNSSGLDSPFLLADHCEVSATLSLSNPT
jgi:hypothetical protein